MLPNSVDSIVTDPPYHLTSTVKRFGKDDAAPAQFGTDGVYARSSKGFMGQTWDGGNIAFKPEIWAAAHRVAKPGAYLLAFGVQELITAWQLQLRMQAGKLGTVLCGYMEVVFQNRIM